MKNYTDQYKDPRWQKKRLEILDRDDFACRSCGESESELHVHHLHYIKNCFVWEYDDSCFVSLCKNCHEEITEYTNTMIYIVRQFGRSTDLAYYALSLLVKINGMDPKDLSDVEKFINKLKNV